MNSYIKLPTIPMVRGRQDFVIHACAGKRVLHVGCVDSGLLEQRFQSGELMHQRLSAVAADLWGVDTDTEGITFLQKKGFNNLLTVDAEHIGQVEALRGQCFDIIVAAELIEHLSNPGLFLNSVKTLMVPGVTDLLVTVPNAFRLDVLLLLFRGIERVHPDHNYWFSYHTITRLLGKHGFQVKQARVYSFSTGEVLPRLDQPARAHNSCGTQQPQLLSHLSPGPSLLRTIKSRSKIALVRALCKISPFWGDGLIVVATLPANEGDRHR